MNTTGTRIKKARQDAKLSAIALGAACFVTRQAVYQWERDETTPTADNFLSIAMATDASISWLIRGEAVPSIDKTMPKQLQVAEKRRPYEPSAEELHTLSDELDSKGLAAFNAVLDRVDTLEKTVQLELATHEKNIAATLEKFRKRFEKRLDTKQAQK